MADESGVPYQSLINLYLRDCVAQHRKLSIDWPSQPGIIALQNLPEGFNACREVTNSTHYRVSQVVGAFALMALLGPISGLTGYFVLSEFPEVVSAIMLFAAGGILYLIFQDIAPQARLKKHWAPPLGAVTGFLLDVLGKVAVGA